MSDNTTNDKVKDDEIDLLELIRRIGRTLIIWINALLKALLISFVFLIRRWLPLGISILVGIGLSYFLRNTHVSSYTSDLTLRNNLVKLDNKLRDNSGTTSELISKINKLHQFCAEGNINALSKALFIDINDVKNVSDISAFWIIDRGKDGIPDYVDYEDIHNIYDTMNLKMQNRFDIRLKISSGIDLNKVRDGILKYIEKDSLNQQRNILRIQQNRDLLNRLNYDIKQLDSLQKVKYFEETRNIKPFKEGQIVFMQEQKTQLFYVDIQFLYEKKQVLEKDIELYRSVVTVLNDFSIPTKRENGVMYYGKQIIPIVFLLTLLFLILRANRKKLNEIFKKY